MWDIRVPTCTVHIHKPEIQVPLFQTRSKIWKPYIQPWGGGGVTTAAKEQHASLRYSSEMYIISKKMCITHICIVVTTQFKGTVYQFTTNSPGCVGTAFRNN